jgi:hypothetical protein
MKILMCSLAAILTVALGSGSFAAAEEVVVTGTVEGFDKDGSMYLRDLGTATFSAAGNYAFKFTVNGKNPSAPATRSRSTTSS